MTARANTASDNLARGISAGADGAHTRALLAGNAEAAREAREARQILATYDFAPEENRRLDGRECQVMTVSRTSANGDLDLVTVFRAIDDPSYYNALAIYATVYPLASYAQAVRMRCAANREAAQKTREEN